MVALAYTDFAPPAPPATPTVRAVRAVPAPRRAVQAASDPVVDMTTRLLSAPLRHVYAMLWRAGLLLIDD